MNANSSGVAFSAAKMRSPSFSRSSSSTTTTALPAAMSAMARSIPAKSVTGVLASPTIVLPRPRQVWAGQPLDVLRQDINFEVDQVSSLPVAERREGECGRNQRNAEVVGTDLDHRQRHAVHRDGPLLHHVP